MRKIDKLWLKEAKEWLKEKEADIKENNILIDNAMKLMLVCRSKIKALRKQNAITLKMIPEQKKIIKKVEEYKCPTKTKTKRKKQG